jgi:hypothetical protein
MNKNDMIYVARAVSRYWYWCIQAARRPAVFAKQQQSFGLVSRSSCAPCRLLKLGTFSRMFEANVPAGNKVSEIS